MIVRIWRGWTEPTDAEEYEQLLRAEILPRIAEETTDGYHGAHLLRRERDEEVEFATILWFDTEEDLQSFAGVEETKRAEVPPSARRLLSRYDEWATHYRQVLTPSEATGNADGQSSGTRTA